MLVALNALGVVSYRDNVKSSLAFLKYKEYFSTLIWESIMKKICQVNINLWNWKLLAF